MPSRGPACEQAKGSKDKANGGGTVLGREGFRTIGGVNYTGFIGGQSNKPTPIPAREIDKIMQQMQEGIEKPRPKVLYEVGEQVRIKDGPFTDFNGNVEEVNYEKSKVRVSVTIFGRATPVELEFGQVEKV